MQFNILNGRTLFDFRLVFISIVDWSVLSVIDLNIWCYFSAIVCISKLFLLILFCRPQQLWHTFTLVQFNVNFVRVTLALVIELENCIRKTLSSGFVLLCIAREFRESRCLIILVVQIFDSIVSGRALLAEMRWLRSSWWSNEETRCLIRKLLSCCFHHLSGRWVTILLRSFQARLDLFHTLFRFVNSLCWLKWLWCF